MHKNKTLVRLLSRRTWIAMSLAFATTVSVTAIAAEDAGTTTAPAAMLVPAEGLSLQQAIQLAISHNLQTLLAAERSREAGGAAREALSPLLPNFSGAVSQGRGTTNLRAQGLDFPGLPSLVGPFDTFDARARLVQTVFNLSAWRRHEAAEMGIDVAHMQEQLAREQVASASTIAYVEVLRTRQAVAAAQANLDLAQSLQRLAEDQHKVGVANGLDVARASTRVAQNQSALIQAQGATQRANLQLQRLLGLPLGPDITLSDAMRISDAPLPNAETAIDQAGKGRYELQIAQQQVTRSDYERRAAEAGHMPSLALTGDYGRSANTPNRNAEDTYRYGLQLEIPIFDGGLTNSRVDEASSRKRQAELESDDLRLQVEQDVRQSLISLQSATDRLHAAQDTQNLADRELQLARDRFAAGAADSIEVDNAEASLANARYEMVGALSDYSTARANLAAAVGQAESFRL